MAAHSHNHPRIRAMRLTDSGTTIAARADALRPFLGLGAEHRLASLRRMLRLERRAARAGGGYDAARHAALRRLIDEATRVPK